MIVEDVDQAAATANISEEYAGEAVRSLSMEGRLTLCNLSTEMGARGVMVAPDETTFEYLKGREHAPKGEAWDKALAYWDVMEG